MQSLVRAQQDNLSVPGPQAAWRSLARPGQVLLFFDAVNVGILLFTQVLGGIAREPKRRFVTSPKLFHKVCNLGISCVSEMTRTSGPDHPLCC